MQLRKCSFLKEAVYREAGKAAAEPVTRVAVLAVLNNPYAGGYTEDLAQLSDLGLAIGECAAGEAVAMLPRTPVAYGKSAIVGVNGDIEHAAALLHPKLGKPMRAACGGGESLIPSTTKVAAAGTVIDVPLAHKDEAWSFDELDTITVFMADAPRPDEILMVMAFADGGRPSPRIGKGRSVT